MPLVKINFPLGGYTPPALNDVDSGLSVYAPTLDGDDFAIIGYSPPALNAVNFALSGGAPTIVETIIAMDFPMLYRAEPITAKEVRSRVRGATITKVANIFPQELLKAGKAGELRSKWA